MKHFTKITAFLMMVALLSCDSTTEKPSDRGEEYIPLQKGRFQIYDIDQTIYSAGHAQTLSYELKTLVADSFLNAEGGYTYVINRSKRSAGETAWQNLDTWSVRINKQEAVVNEQNIPYVVLRFPLIEGMEWNGNQYNNTLNTHTNSSEDVYLLEQKGKPFVINDLNYNDCLVINQEDNQEFIVYFDKRTEVYSRGIGLLYKEKIQLNYCTAAHCIGQQIVETGEVYKQSIKEYGIEE